MRPYKFKVKSIQAAAREILNIEARAIRNLIPQIGKNFEKAVNLMAECQGRVIVTGMGKPGFIGRKIAATLASTGTPSFFVHPAEAVHGDLGMITEKDVIIALSQSGETAGQPARCPSLCAHFPQGRHQPATGLRGKEYSKHNHQHQY